MAIEVNYEKILKEVKEASANGTFGTITEFVKKTGYPEKLVRQALGKCFAKAFLFSSYDETFDKYKK